MKCIKLLKKITIYLTIHLVILSSLPLVAQSLPKKIIFETDMCLDVDDVGALAILHALANNGEAEILAVCFNEEHENGVGAIDAINTWYGRGDIPIGVYKGNLVNDWSSNSSYLSYLDNNFPNDIDKESADSAVTVYRKILSQQPDSSVTIVSVGFTNNLNDLLLAEPELIEKKVVELVQMAGVNNDGFNFVMHNLSNVSKNVLENWPTPIVISQEGGDIYTGDNLSTAPIENPVRWAFYKWFNDSFEGRSSWDEMAVLYGVRGLSSYFYNITTGSGSLDGYIWQMEPGFRSYLNNRKSNSFYVELIEDLMDQLPLGAHFRPNALSGWVPFTVELDASSSQVDGNRTIESYLWNFGDGTSGVGQVVTHEYTMVGEYDIQLTLIDNLGDSLISTETIRTSDPIFSPIDFFGNVKNYIRSQNGLWNTLLDSNDLRLYLSNEKRDPENIFPGFNFVKDSLYSDFNLKINVRTDEDLAQNTLADYSIVFGYQDEKNYNQLLVKHTTSKLFNVTNGQSTDIVRVTTKGIPDEKYHQLSLNLSDDQILVMIDDEVFLETSSFRLPQEGKIGFGSAKYSMFFDDVEIIRKGSTTSADHEVMTDQFRVWQNYPNPFNPSTNIKFALPMNENVKIEIYNILGQKLKTLVNESMPKGYHEVKFNGHNLMTGVYFCKIEAGDFIDLMKMTLVK